jgi:hypothetical protein
MSDQVWLVMEYHKDRPKEQRLYGAFDSEASAQRDYGDIEDPYGIEIVSCRVFGQTHSDLCDPWKEPCGYCGRQPRA